MPKEELALGEELLMDSVINHRFWLCGLIILKDRYPFEDSNWFSYEFCDLLCESNDQMTYESRSIYELVTRELKKMVNN